jgi:transcriptional regulator with XRE-family HTH domain
MAKFGALLRQTRSQAGVSMGKVARYLGMKVSHLSDVEFSRRAPLSAERIRKVAELLQVDAQPLLLAAAEEKGVFELDTQNVSARKRAFVAALARELPDMDDVRLSHLEEIVRRKEDR